MAEAPELKALVAAGNKVKTHEVIRLADGLAVVLFGMTLPGTYAGYGTASKPIEEVRDVIDRIRQSARCSNPATPVTSAAAKVPAANRSRSRTGRSAMAHPILLAAIGCGDDRATLGRQSG
jgi:hypothetical protein